MSHLDLNSMPMPRSFLPTQPSGNEVDMESGNLEGEKARVIRTTKAIKIPNQALLSGMAYCISSCSMILINKFVLSSYDFNAGISLMLYQVIPSPLLCLSYCKRIGELETFIFNFAESSFCFLLQNFVSVLIVSTLSVMGVISTEPLTWKLLKVWLPVNIIFVGMLISSMFR